MSHFLAGAARSCANKFIRRGVGSSGPPRYNGVRYSADAVRQLELDIQRMSVEGGTLTVGDVRLYNAYGPGGPTDAHAALAEASQLSLQLINNVMSMIPGPIGMAWRLAQLINAVGKGDYSQLGMALLGVLSRIAPCGLGNIVGIMLRGASLIAASQNIADVIVGLQNGDPFIGFKLFTAAGDLFNMLRACFTGETELMARGTWGTGWRRIDQIVIGDEVLSRDENDVNGPLTWKQVEELFVRFAPIMNLHVGGKIIRTTAEHPFYVYNKGWVACAQLQIGDVLVSHDGQRVRVEGVAFGGEFDTVYNMRVADFHTYFVGGEDWASDVWAHNVSCGESADVQQNGSRNGVRERGRSIPGRRPGSNGHQDHQEGVAAAAAQAESTRRPNERVAVQERIAHPDSNRIPDVQVIDTTTNRVVRIIEVERRPNSRFNQNREAEYGRLGISNVTLPVPGIRYREVTYAANRLFC